MQTNPALGYFEDLFPLLPVPIALLAYRLRDLIENVAPKAFEMPNPKEHHADYGLGPNRREFFSYLCPMDTCVRLGFYYGDALPDPAGLLIKEGKGIRHIQLTTLADVDRPEIRALLQAAVAERKTVLGLQ